MSFLEQLREGAEGSYEASGEEALAYLEEIVLPVLNGMKPRQVIAGNICNQGEVGPLIFDNTRTKSISIIKTSDGWRRVDDETWAEALKDIVKRELTLDLLECVKEGAGDLVASSKTQNGNFRQEIYHQSPAYERSMFLIVVKEFEGSSGDLVLLGLEVGNELPPSK